MATFLAVLVLAFAVAGPALAQDAEQQAPTPDGGDPPIVNPAKKPPKVEPWVKAAGAFWDSLLRDPTGGFQIAGLETLDAIREIQEEEMLKAEYAAMYAAVLEHVFGISVLEGKEREAADKILGELIKKWEFDNAVHGDGGDVDPAVDQLQGIVIDVPAR